MPELPEVETVRAGLAAALIGQRIAALELRRGDLRHPFPPDLVQSLVGATIEDLQRRAKYLLMPLDSGLTVIVHLGMSGRMLLHASRPADFETHDHVVMTLGNGTVLVFNDARRFGLWLLAESAALAEHPLLAHLGPEPLEAAFSGAVLHAALARRGGAVKPVLMDQTLVVGVGNIYASEALFHQRIHPATPANRLSPSDCTGLVASIRAVLRAAIASGGSTLRDFVRSSGDIGYFQHAFQVYGRTGLPCLRCATPIAQITQAARSTFFCPRCQPLQRTKKSAESTAKRTATKGRKASVRKGM